MNIKLIKSAIKDGVNARKEFYISMCEPDEQQLGLPASDRSIISIEKIFHFKLPPSYRTFLSLHDGWNMIDATSDLYSCEKIVQVNQTKEADELKKLIIHRNSKISKLLIIGGSSYTASNYLLDLNKINKNGENPIIDYEKGIEDQYSSFLEFLTITNIEYLELTKDINNGFDYENI